MTGVQTCALPIYLRTNKSIDIPARKVPKFVAGKNLKDVVK